MLTIIISWILMTFLFIGIGGTVVNLIYKGRCEHLLTEDVFLVMGIMTVNIYAQIFSLFGGIRSWAALLLVVVGLGCAYVAQTRYMVYTRLLDGIRSLDRTEIVLLIIIFAGLLIWTDMVPRHYDTYLYHAQAIHWVEDYGCVRGLANLHFRFAYNSAFFPLQALFSFGWFLPGSLHTFNGFITCFLFVFITLSLIRCEKGSSKPALFVMLCWGTLLYIGYDAYNISSPNTDTWALLLIMYIMIKWVEYGTEEKADTCYYSFLSVLTIYATTLKLSVGIMVLLSVLPGWWMIRERKIREVIWHVLAGAVILIPYVLRSYITSGYLVYPVEYTGFVNSEWKLPVDMLRMDRAYIQAYARGNYDITRLDEHIWQWFGEWFRNMELIWKPIFVISVITFILLIIRLVRDIRSITASPVLWAGLCSVAGMLFWLETSPLPRYGGVYMIIIICLSFASYEKILSVLRRFTVPMLYGIGIMYILAFAGYAYVKDTYSENFIMQSDYANRETVYESLGGYDIAVPVEGDQTGYEPFPSTCKSLPENLVLRGTTLKDGFVMTQ